MQLGWPLKFWRSEKAGPEKKIMLILPLKIESFMIFCEVDAYFTWGKRWALKKLQSNKGGGIFCTDLFCFVLFCFFFLQPPPPPTPKCLLKVPDLSNAEAQARGAGRIY